MKQKYRVTFEVTAEDNQTVAIWATEALFRDVEGVAITNWSVNEA